MNSNNLVTLSFKLLLANRKKSRFIKVIIFIIFFLCLFFVNTLFSSFEKAISTFGDISSPLFIATKNGGEINLQSNPQIRKSCIKKEEKESIVSFLSPEYEAKEGFIFSTYFTEITSKNSGRVIVELIDFSSIDSSYLQKNEENKNQNRALKIYVNNAFASLFKMEEDYLVYVTDFFENVYPLRFRVDFIIMNEESDNNARAYIDIGFMKQFLNVPENLSFPLFISKRNNIKIFTPSYLETKREVSKIEKDSNVTIKPFYSIDSNTNEIFTFYVKVLFSVVIAVVLILLYAMSISYYINFNTRKRDFAIFRSFGLTNKKLYWLMFLENFYTCFASFITSIVLNIIIGLTVKNVKMGNINLSFSFSYPGLLVLIIILLLTSFISILKAYRHIIKASSMNALMERR